MKGIAKRLNISDAAILAREAILRPDHAPMDAKPYSAGIDLRRHNLTSTDVRLWRLQSIRRL